ncbi:MAG: hypothetical protein ABI895_17955 [Deltaproteobacteria bacterium]
MKPAPRSRAARARFAAGLGLSAPQRALLPLLAILVLGAVFNVNGAFFRWQTHAALLREVSVTGILACGMTVVIVSGGIDLAVGSLLGLCAVSFALLTPPLALPGGLVLVLVLGLGSAAGALSGALIGRLELPPFIVTLAMMVLPAGSPSSYPAARRYPLICRARTGNSRRSRCLKSILASTRVCSVAACRWSAWCLPAAWG